MNSLKFGHQKWLKKISKKTNLAKSATKVFGNKVRIRVCGLLYREDKLLLIKHQMDDYYLWAPPGGGIEFGESVEETLRREFKEETGLVVEIGDFLFLTEHLKPPLHAIELFYQVKASKFDVSLGVEPEVDGRNLLLEFRFVGEDELAELKREELHSSLKSCTNPIELLDKRGHLI